MKTLSFVDSRDSAESLLELRRAVIAGEARVTSWGIDDTGKLSIRMTIPGSETVRPKTSGKR